MIAEPGDLPFANPLAQLVVVAHQVAEIVTPPSRDVTLEGSWIGTAPGTHRSVTMEASEPIGELLAVSGDVITRNNQTGNGPQVRQHVVHLPLLEIVAIRRHGQELRLHLCAILRVGAFACRCAIE